MAEIDRDDVVRRIRKLLRRAQSNPGPEADTALLIAKKLQAKHGIEVEVEVDETWGPRVEARTLEVEPKKPIWWRSILLGDIAPRYACQSMATRGDDGIKWFLWLMGPPDEVQRCAVHYEYLLTQILQVAAEVGRDPWDDYDEAEWLEGVCCGALQGLVDRLPGATPEASPPGGDRPGGPTGSPGGGVTVGIAIHNDQALMRTWVPERVEAEGPPAGPDIRSALPTVEIDPPRRAFRRGQRGAAGRSPEPPSVCFGAIEGLELRLKTAEILRKSRVVRVYDLMRMRPRQLRAVPGIGRGRLYEILTALADHGLELRPDW